MAPASSRLEVDRHPWPAEPFGLGLLRRHRVCCHARRMHAPPPLGRHHACLDCPGFDTETRGTAAHFTPILQSNEKQER
jgi:hypothetical protein